MLTPAAAEKAELYTRSEPHGSETLAQDAGASARAASPASGLGASWERVRTRLRAELGEDVYQSWFARMEFEGLSEGCIRLSVPTRFLKGWVQAHYGSRLLALWRSERSEIGTLDVVVRSAVLKNTPVRPLERRTAAPKTQNMPETDGTVSSSQERQQDRTQERPQDRREDPIMSLSGACADALGSSPLDPRLTFETFVVGTANGLAHAAAMQVAQAGAGAHAMFTPLYLHAGVGLGKTHLLHAIAWKAQKSGRNVLYLTAEKFMYSFVAALKNQSALAYKEAMRGIDILLIDDLQFLQGRQLQQEFCHTLNALIDAGRHVVVAADRPPADLETLDERVQSRLAGGLTVAVGTLDEKLRHEILRTRIVQARARDQGFEVPDAVVGYIARTVSQNGRDLEGALNRLLAHHKLTGVSISLETAEEALKDLIRTQEPKRVKIEDIQRLVAKHYNVSRADMLSSRRTANVVKPRQVAMYLAKTLTLRSLPEIGRRFGGRDHTTVLHAVRKIDGMVGQDRSLADELDLLRRLLQD